MMKILIAYDGSDCAEAAITDLQRAGLPEETTALVLSLADVFLPAGRQIRDPKQPDWMRQSIQNAGRSALGRLCLGSVSLSVLAHSAVAVRIGRSQAKSSSRARRILVGFDGSRQALAALHHVSRRHWPKGTEIK